MYEFGDGSSSVFGNFAHGFCYGWATLVALFLILLFHFAKRFFCLPASSSSRRPIPLPSAASPSRQLRVTEADLRFLIENLDEKLTLSDHWEHVIDKSNDLISYTAKCCKSKDEPLKYLSVTVFENCSPEILVDFYMDNDYRKQWDKTIVQHEKLEVDETTGTEIGHTIKKFPLLTPREYVLAWRLWKGKDKTFYCFTKECEHPLAPRTKKYVRVGLFRSGWRIRKVPGRNACAIRMYHQEDAGLNVDMAKLAFSRGIWSYVCKMDNALRKYSAIGYPRMGPVMSAVTLIRKVPPGLEAMDATVGASATPEVTNRIEIVTDDRKDKKLQRKTSGKILANGLLLVGGLVCLSRGHSSFGAKVAMAYILTKLRKRDQQSRQT